MAEEHRRRVIRQKLARMEAAPPLSLPSGFPSLDAVIGGLPRGRIVELFGPSGSAKTTFALRTVAHLQHNGGAAAWVDAEHAFDPAYAVQLGVTVERLPVARPESAEQALEIVRQLVLSGAVDLLVIDSAAALTPEIELRTGIGKSGAGAQSRALGSGLRKLRMALRWSGATVLFLNQTRARDEAEVPAGGPPLKLFAAMRISLRAAADGKTYFRVLKNKGSHAFAEGELLWEDGPGLTKCP